MDGYGYRGLLHGRCDDLVRSFSLMRISMNRLLTCNRWTAVTMMVIIVICGIGVWPASYVVGGEASALHLRAKSQGVGWFASGLATGVFSIVLPYIFNADQGNLRAKTGFVFAGLCLIGVVVSWFTIPEMKGRTAIEIDRMFELKLKARDFKNWVSDLDQMDRNRERKSATV